MKPCEERIEQRRIEMRAEFDSVVEWFRSRPYKFTYELDFDRWGVLEFLVLPPDFSGVTKVVDEFKTAFNYRAWLTRMSDHSMCYSVRPKW